MMDHDVAADDVAVSVGTLSVIAVPLTATTAVTVYLKDNMGGGENIDCIETRRRRMRNTRRYYGNKQASA